MFVNILIDCFLKLFKLIPLDSAVLYERNSRLLILFSKEIRFSRIIFKFKSTSFMES